MSIVDDIKQSFSRPNNGLINIIIINIFFFVVINIVDLFFQNFSSYFSLSAHPGLVVKHVWTIITYMFLHKELFHIFFNMLWLYWVGIIFVDFMGSKRLVGLYLLGGISGGLLYILLGNFIYNDSSNVYLLGASASVMAIVVATAVLVPNYMLHLLFFGPVKLKYLALISFILTTLIDLNQNTGGKIAHLGGAIFGYFYIVQYKKGIDFTNASTRFFSFAASLFRKSPDNMKVAFKRSSVANEDYNLIKVANQETVDRILDKISKSGYASLTKTEKDILFKASKEK